MSEAVPSTFTRCARAGSFSALLERTAARWNTISGGWRRIRSSTSGPSRRLPTTHSAQCSAAASGSSRRSRATTSYPDSTRRGRRPCPISPPAPVTSATRLANEAHLPTRAGRIPGLSRGDEDARTGDLVAREAKERLVRTIEGEPDDTRADPRSGGLPEQVLSVRSRVRLDARERLLVEEVLLVAHRGDVGHVDPGEGHRSSLANGPERRRDDLAGGREHDGGIERGGDGVVRVARPGGAELRGESAMSGAARRDEDLAAAMPRDLEDDVRRGAESEEAEPPAGLDAAPAER